jgi:putative tricarboxylic transport membrane protein
MGFVLGVASASLCAQPVAWKPDRNVELVVGVSPGGGMDKIARLVQQNIQVQRLVGTNVTVVNKPGGGGTIALNYLNQHAGNPHFLGVFSIGLVTNQIMGLTPINHTELTPIGLLTSEYVGFALNAASPLRGANDVIQRLRKDAGSMSISFASSRGNANHLAIVLVMKAAGVDHKLLRTPVFNSAGEATVALLGGHVDMAASGIANFIPHFQAGKLRPLAISGPRRLGGALADVPTWKEQGIDVVMSNWYVLVAPKDLGAAQVAYWEDVSRKVTQSEEWQKALRDQNWDSSFLDSAATRRYLAAQHEEFRAALVDLNLAK